MGDPNPASKIDEEIPDDTTMNAGHNENSSEQMNVDHNMEQEAGLLTVDEAGGNCAAAAEEAGCEAGLLGAVDAILDAVDPNAILDAMDPNAILDAMDPNAILDAVLDSDVNRDDQLSADNPSGHVDSEPVSNPAPVAQPVASATGQQQGGNVKAPSAAPEDEPKVDSIPIFSYETRPEHYKPTDYSEGLKYPQTPHPRNEETSR